MKRSDTQKRKKAKRTIQITPIRDQDTIPQQIQGEDPFTPIVAENAMVEEIRRLCTGYGVAQDLKNGKCGFCLLQLRCLNVMRMGVPVKIEHFRQQHFGGNPFFSEAVEQTQDYNLEENLATVIQWSLEDIGEYQKDDDPLNEERVGKLLSIHCKEVLKTIDPRVPVLMFEKLKAEKDLHTENGFYYLKSEMPF